MAARATNRFTELWNHPAGPRTVHFWAPAFKWGLVIAGLKDIDKPVELVSTPQTVALASTGLIWSRFATQITPVNYNLLSVNLFVAATGCYQLYRKAAASLGAGATPTAAAASPPRSD